jgi:hypothetical protein
MAWLSKWITDEWKSAWKWSQTWLAGAVVAAPVLYTQVQTLQDYIPHTVFRYVMSVLGLAIIFNTLRKKNGTPPGPTP